LQGSIVPFSDGSGHEFQALRFSGVRFDEPGEGAVRTLTFANLRVNAARRLDDPGPVVASVSASGVKLASSTANVGFVAPGYSMATRSADDSAAANAEFHVSESHNAALAADNRARVSTIDFNLKFSEGFANSFRTREAGAVQNSPATTWFSESGFANPDFSDNLSTAGHADTATRLVARFTGVPEGVKVFVTVAPSPHGTDSSVDARLISADENGFGGSDVTPTTSVQIEGHALGLAPVAISNGNGTAVWEIRAADGASIEAASFGVVFAFNKGAGDTDNAPGRIEGMLGPVDA